MLNLPAMILRALWVDVNSVKVPDVLQLNTHQKYMTGVFVLYICCRPPF